MVFFLIWLTSYPCQLLKNLQIVKTLCLHIHMYVIPMSLLSMLALYITLYDAPYKLETRLSLSVYQKILFLFQISFAFVLFCGKMIIYFILFIKILITLKFSFGTFEVWKHANFVLQLYSYTLNLSLIIDWLLMHYYYHYYFANNDPKVMIVYMCKFSQPLDYYCRWSLLEIGLMHYEEEY
jgi:hypothetical protein